MAYENTNHDPQEEIEARQQFIAETIGADSKFFEPNQDWLEITPEDDWLQLAQGGEHMLASGVSFVAGPRTQLAVGNALGDAYLGIFQRPLAAIQLDIDRAVGTTETERQVVFPTAAPETKLGKAMIDITGKYEEYDPVPLWQHPKAPAPKGMLYTLGQHGNFRLGAQITGEDITNRLEPVTMKLITAAVDLKRVESGNRWGNGKRAA